jgi:hypothetical protein
MLLVKAVAGLVEVVLAGVLAASDTFDGTAYRVSLYAAAFAGVAWTWKNVLRPVAKILHRMALGVEALEELPRWRETTDLRIEHLERSGLRIESGQEAILRELGLEDKVRRTWEAEGKLREVEDERRRP